MSNVKRLDFWTVVRTILENNPGIQAKFLILELLGKTGMNRSTIYDHLCTFDNQDRIYREKGKYYLPKDNPHLAPKIQRNSSHSPPKILFEITQQIYNQPNNKRKFPNVGFFLKNINRFPIKVRVEALPILGSKKLGLIQDKKKYYNGETVWGPFDYNEGVINANFHVPMECVNGSEELTLVVRIFVIDPFNREHVKIKGWTYIPTKNDWFFEPKDFSEIFDS